jgi:hypothetical protein
MPQKEIAFSLFSEFYNVQIKILNQFLNAYHLEKLALNVKLFVIKELKENEIFISKKKNYCFMLF